MGSSRIGHPASIRFLRGSPGTIQLGALHGYGLLRLGSS
jgi:hypothetical protein